MTVDDYEFRTKLIALEIEICKQLASNDVNIRKRGLRRLRAFLSRDEIAKSGVEDFNRIWTGLFIYVWASDTPLVQEADADEISNLIHGVNDFDATLLFVRGFFTTITSQWDRISHHRTDKFLMFIRRFLRQIFFFLKNSDWNSEKTAKLSSELFSAIQIFPVELTQHLNDIYTEELAKVSEGSIPTDALILLLKCFVDCIVQQKPSKAVVNHINTNIFCALVRQVKLFIKQKAAMEFDSEAFSLEEPESDSCPNLDPRPGNAHVFLPYIDFDENKMVEFFEESISAAEVSRKSKNIMEQIIKMFESVSRLRQTIMQPTKILNEVNARESKPKKKPVKFSSVTKRAVKRLHDMDDDFGSRKMKKLLRSSAWEVTENVKVSSPKTSDRQDWTVSDLRRKGPVSFREETESFTYQMDPGQPSKTGSVPISVPRTACDDRPGILLPNEVYNIVDFKSDPPSEDSIQVDSLEETTCIDPPWTSTKLKISDPVKAPVKNVRRSTRGKSMSLEIPEMNESEEPLKRRRYSVKPARINETLEEVSDVEKPTVMSTKVKRASSRKSSVISSRTREEEQLPEQDESDCSELAVISKKVSRASSRKSSVISARTREEEQLPEQDESDCSELAVISKKVRRASSRKSSVISTRTREEVELPERDELDSSKPAVMSKKIKRASSRKSSVISTRPQEEVQLSERDESDCSELAVKSQKVKRASSRKSSVIRTRPQEEVQLSERDESDCSEIPEREEKTGRIKSIVKLSKYEPRKTRSGRIYNV